MYNRTLTEYGPSNQWQNLVFDGDERKFELWETKIHGYLKLKGLKEITNPEGETDEEQNEMAFAEIIQFLDERSLALVMRDAKDNGKEALSFLRANYAGSGKPRIITLYNQLTTLKKSHSENITDYFIRAENAATALDAADEKVSDSLLIAMVLKGLPEEYTPFVSVITQEETLVDF